MNIDTMGLIFGIFSSRFCARFWRMSSLCQVRADTNLAKIEKFCFSIFATLFAHSISQTAVKFNGSFYNI